MGAVAEKRRITDADEGTKCESASTYGGKYETKFTQQKR